MCSSDLGHRVPLVGKVATDHVEHEEGTGVPDVDVIVDFLERRIRMRAFSYKRLFKKLIDWITKIVVAQRVSTITGADLILVLDEGRLTAAGTHEELLEASRTYREIVISQLGSEAFV